MLLEAFERVVLESPAPVKLMLFGEGPLRAELEAQIHERGLGDRVVLTGALPHGELLDRFRRGQVHIAALASRVTEDGAQEGIPVSLMEAMAYGIPVVATDSGGVRELLDGAGLLVPPDDPSAFATALLRLLADPEERAQLGAAGRAAVGASFDNRRTTDELLTMIVASSAARPGERRVTYLACDDVRAGQASEKHVAAISDGLGHCGWRVRVFAPRHGGTRSPLRRLLAIVAVQISAAIGLKPHDILYVRSHPLAFVAALIARIRGAAVVQEINGSAEDLIDVWPVARRLAPLLRWTMARQIGACDLAIGVTPQLAVWAAGLGADRTAVIPNGVDTQSFRPNVPARRHAPAGPYVIFVGTLAPWQGLPSLIAAAGEPEWPAEVQLVVVGDGPLRDQVDQAAGRLPHLRSLGPVPPSDIPGLLAGALAAVVPAGGGRRSGAASGEYELGLSPLKLFEAMSCGVPVIASDQPGLGDLVRESGAGLVVPTGDSRALAKAVAWLEQHPEEAGAMGRRARTEAVEHHDWSQRAAETDNALRELVGSRSVRW
jgi:glycosyltransferase involved in cell wall biosynthesis